MVEKKTKKLPIPKSFLFLLNYFLLSFFLLLFSLWTMLLILITHQNYHFLAQVFLWSINLRACAKFSDTPLKESSNALYTDFIRNRCLYPSHGAKSLNYLNIYNIYIKYL